MDFFDILLQAGLITAALVVYLILFRKPPPLTGNYRQPGWNYPLKYLCALYAVKRWKSRKSKSSRDLHEKPRQQSEGLDSISFRCAAPDGAAVLLAIRKVYTRKPLAEVTVHVKLTDGTTYKLPQLPDSVVGVWESIDGGWSAGGLKVQVLEPQTRLRILFNGLLRRDQDGAVQHVKFNALWTSATPVTRHPDDWSEQLSARALALEPWRDGKWASLLDKYGDGSWMQWGVIQGRFISYDKDGGIHKSCYLRVRGAKERRWAPKGYQGLRRTAMVTVVAIDGTAIQIYGQSHKGILTECISGSVRHPDGSATSIKSCDFVMSEFCEYPGSMPQAYTINVSTVKRSFKLALRVGCDGGRVYSGMPYQHEVCYRTLSGTVGYDHCYGFLELGYEPSVKSEPPYPIPPARVLKWLKASEAGVVGYCVPFEARAAACPDFVGGKGASLALLASVQRDEGYRVPPGFCLTTQAMQKHIEMNPELLTAIKEIEAANENYDEKNFKEKCNKASVLFAVTSITGQLKEEILIHMTELRNKVIDEQLGPELRFAVRSSAVGEDSEALSAAGQNETVLGCVSGEDVLLGVQKCWGSMFAFTSAHYRRQNGQACLCGGGVVVQALVRARVAGVMFTRHPDAGDPSRILITANFGLGESVVSGSVEPDTITITHDLSGDLTITKIDLGSKSHRVTTGDRGVVTEEVTEAERKVPCLSESETLRLARFGCVQDELWGAGRDIEWAICGTDVFLLQARPITSLERWTEEELLHEHDDPVMADDELITFANTGEVLPKPISPLSYDLVIKTLMRGMDSLIDKEYGDYISSILVTHNRCAISSYNALYRRTPKKIDVGVKMMEMALHGHTVADEYILSRAQHRRPANRTDVFHMLSLTIKSFLTSKWAVDDAKRRVKAIEFLGKGIEDASELFETVLKMNEDMDSISFNHAVTSTASSASQAFAMAVLLEGRSDFSAEQCNEISTILSSGNVLSADVPLSIAKIARELQESDRFEMFRKQDPKQALDWLRENLPHVHLNVRVFLDEHGHRGIMEFDLATKTWVLVPEELMKVLQNMRASTDENKTAKSDAEVIASLKTPQKSSTRKILRWLLSLCRRSVRHREGTKAQLILAIHKIRMAFYVLADLLVKKWYLPHRDLVFFFRVHELRNYIKTRDPALLKKAIQRHQYHPQWCKLQFAEMQTGWPKPLATSGPALTGVGTLVRATPVCGGEVVARACVVKDLSQIDQLQRGDVLITRSTDIGWSPYFPLITGIATELGGLISHGAVIAREYGLPSIVGATNVTNMFNTGDMVRLSGTEGVLEKVLITSETTS